MRMFITIMDTSVACMAAIVAVTKTSDVIECHFPSKVATNNTNPTVTAAAAAADNCNSTNAPPPPTPWEGSSQWIYRPRSWIFFLSFNCYWIFFFFLNVITLVDGFKILVFWIVKSSSKYIYIYISRVGIGQLFNPNLLDHNHIYESNIFIFNFFWNYLLFF